MNRIDQYYEQTYIPALKDSDLGEQAKFHALFQSAGIPREKCILDIGCGPGITLQDLTATNTVIGIDIVREYLELSRDHGYAGVLRGDIARGLPFRDTSMDIVVCSDAIEHVFDTEFLGREIYRVLKPDGYAILNVPNQNALPYRLRFLAGRGINIHPVEDWNYFHIRFFTWGSWQEYLARTGFTICAFYPVPVTLSNFFNIRRGGQDTGRKTIAGTFYHHLARNRPNLFSYRFLVRVQKTRSVTA